MTRTNDPRPDQHSAGPLVIDAESPHVVRDGDGRSVAVFSSVGPHAHDAPANARLFVAGHDMLALLRECHLKAVADIMVLRGGGPATASLVAREEAHAALISSAILRATEVP